MYRYTSLTFLRELAFWIAGLIILAPAYVLVALSLKTPTDAIKSSPIAPPQHPTLSNYRGVVNFDGGGSATFAQSFLNSALVTAAVIIIVVVLGAPASYAIARRASRLATGLFWLFVAGLILPFQLGFLPLFVMLTRLGLTGSRTGLVVSTIGVMLPLAVFLYVGFFRSLALDYEEAALVDGASRTRIFCQVVIPLVRPVTTTVAILVGIYTWNDFFMPVVLVGGSTKATLPVLIQSFVGNFVSQWNLIFAGITMAIIPALVVFLLARRRFMQGFSSGVRG